MKLFISEVDHPRRDRLRDMIEDLRSDESHEREIKPGMPPEEVADIVSDKMIAMLRRDLRMDEWVEILKRGPQQPAF